MSEPRVRLMIPSGDLSWFLDDETLEPIYNWHLPYPPPFDPPAHVLEAAERIRREREATNGH